MIAKFGRVGVDKLEKLAAFLKSPENELQWTQVYNADQLRGWQYHKPDIGRFVDLNEIRCFPIRDVVRLLSATPLPREPRFFKIELSFGLELHPTDDLDAERGIRKTLDEISPKFYCQVHELLFK